MLSCIWSMEVEGPNIDSHKHNKDTRQKEKLKEWKVQKFHEVT